MNLNDSDEKVVAPTTGKGKNYEITQRQELSKNGTCESEVIPVRIKPYSLFSSLLERWRLKSPLHPQNASRSPLQTENPATCLRNRRLYFLPNDHHFDGRLVDLFGNKNDFERHHANPANKRKIRKELDHAWGGRFVEEFIIRIGEN